MSKEEANKFLKFQTCVLKLNICCDGCKKKVRRVLHKIEGVYTVTVDVEERKVTVTGNVDPVTLIKKLNKAGKNAELWPAKGGGNPQNLPGMLLQKAQLEHGKGQQKPQKGGGGGGGIKEQKFQQQQGQGKGLKDLKFPSLKDLKLPFKKDDDKKVKFNLHPKGDFDGGSDYGDEDDDFDDDEDFDDMDDEFGGGGGGMLGDPKMMAKPSPMVNFNQPNAKGKKGGGGGKGGDLVQVTGNAVGGKNGGGGGNPNQANGGGRKGHGADESKNGGGNNKNKGGPQGNHGNPSPNKVGGGGGGGGVGLGRGLPMGQPNMMMGQTGSFPATPGGMPHPGYFPPGAVPPETMMASGNPYQQQQYLQALMQHQQQQRLMMMNGPDRQQPAFSPMQMGYGYNHGYGRPVYAPPPLPYPHGGPSYSMFSDENPNSCSVM